jgi:eukaryotic-like serine/threonine-protein kinase
VARGVTKDKLGTRTEAPSELTGLPPSVETYVRASMGALVEHAAPRSLGRYHLLKVIGAGGMGVVWGAWDPELDRQVAIKLVNPTASLAQERILGEGRALARLSHPNVVPVYDVGVVEDQIYIVMEWVRGKTLRSHAMEPHSVREIVALYRAAGAGLAAAHRAGLVHRDFKPANAILGDDGRVRVVDFGLARGEVRAGSDATGSPSDELTAGAGTPRYMAPEQAAGKELTPAADQYAFGVSLRDALAGRAGTRAREALAVRVDASAREALAGRAGASARDALAGRRRELRTPRWLDEIVARATRPDPADRYPSMDALLAALARDPAIARRRWLAASALGVAATGLIIGQRWLSDDPVERCAGGASDIARTWNDSARERISTHLRGLGPYGEQSAARLADDLDRYSATWAASHRAACLARDRGELTASIYERSLGCLTRARIAFETAVGLASSVEARALPNAVTAARALPRPERCATEAPLSAVEPPRSEIASKAAEVAGDIERAHVLVIGQAATMRQAASDAAKRAEELGYRPLIARAQLVLGRASFPGAMGEAAALWQRARSLALEVGDYPLAIEAYARELFAATVAERATLPPSSREVEGAATMAEALARGLDHRGAFARALLYNNLGALRYSRNDRAAARRWYERAIEASEGGDVGRYELVQAWANLAKVSELPAEQASYLAKASATLARELGPDHPMTLESQLVAAYLVENPRASVAAVRVPCDAYAKLHPHLGLAIEQCSYAQGWILEELGQIDEARAAFARVQVHASVKALATGYLQLLDGKWSEAADAMRALADKLDLAPEFWVKSRSADARLIAALSELELRRRGVAIAQLQHALATLDATAPVLGLTAPHRRRRARVEALLARTLAATDPAAAARHAISAAAWYRTAGGYEKVLEEMDALIKGSP